jgi:transposase
MLADADRPTLAVRPDAGPGWRRRPGRRLAGGTLLEGQSAKHVISDAAYGSRALRETIEALGAKAVIPSNPTRKHPFSQDRKIYRRRNRFERCFNKMKHFRRFDTRYDLRALHFLALVGLVASMIGMR